MRKIILLGCFFFSMACSLMASELERTLSAAIRLLEDKIKSRDYAATSEVMEALKCLNELGSEADFDLWLRGCLFYDPQTINDLSSLGAMSLYQGHAYICPQLRFRAPQAVIDLMSDEDRFARLALDVFNHAQDPLDKLRIAGVFKVLVTSDGKKYPQLFLKAIQNGDASQKDVDEFIAATSIQVGSISFDESMNGGRNREDILKYNREKHPELSWLQKPSGKADATNKRSAETSSPLGDGGFHKCQLGGGISDPKMQGIPDARDPSSRNSWPLWSGLGAVLMVAIALVRRRITSSRNDL